MILKIGGIVIDLGWTLVASLIFLAISFLILKSRKHNKKTKYIALGTISLFSIIAYISIPSIPSKELIIDGGLADLILAIIIGNSLGVLTNKKLSKK